MYSDGNTNVRFYQADTHKRFFALLKSKNIRVNRFKADCGSCSKEIVGEIEKHCKHFYIRANRCSSLYDDISKGHSRILQSAWRKGTYIR